MVNAKSGGGGNDAKRNKCCTQNKNNIKKVDKHL